MTCTKTSDVSLSRYCFGCETGPVQTSVTEIGDKLPLPRDWEKHLDKNGQGYKVVDPIVVKATLRFSSTFQCPWCIPQELIKLDFAKEPTEC